MQQGQHYASEMLSLEARGRVGGERDWSDVLPAGRRAESRLVQPQNSSYA